MIAGHASAASSTVACVETARAPRRPRSAGHVHSSPTNDAAARRRPRDEDVPRASSRPGRLDDGRRLRVAPAASAARAARTHSGDAVADGGQGDDAHRNRRLVALRSAPQTRHAGDLCDRGGAESTLVAPPRCGVARRRRETRRGSAATSSRRRPRACARRTRSIVPSNGSPSSVTGIGDDVDAELAAAAGARSASSSRCRARRSHCGAPARRGARGDVRSRSARRSTATVAHVGDEQRRSRSRPPRVRQPPSPPDEAHEHPAGRGDHGRDEPRPPARPGSRRRRSRGEVERRRDGERVQALAEARREALAAVEAVPGRVAVTDDGATPRTCAPRSPATAWPQAHPAYPFATSATITARPERGPSTRPG